MLLVNFANRVRFVAFEKTQKYPLAETIEQAPRVAWDAASTARLLARAQASNNMIELTPCQQLADQVVKVSSANSESKSRKPSPKDIRSSVPKVP